VSDFVFNIARGQAVALHERVRLNDPAASALVLVVLRLAGLESDDVLRDYDTLSAILAAANDEATNSGYARKSLTDAVLTAPTIDDTLNLARLTIPTQTWTTVAAGDTWAKLLTCYDADTGAGTDANITPILAQDMKINGVNIIPAGTNIQWAVPNGYYVSSS
jgi:hypothetical protein